MWRIKKPSKSTIYQLFLVETNPQPRFQGFSVGEGDGREKTLASADHVTKHKYFAVALSKGKELGTRLSLVRNAYDLLESTLSTIL